MVVALDPFPIEEAENGGVAFLRRGFIVLLIGEFLFGLPTFSFVPLFFQTIFQVILTS